LKIEGERKLKENIDMYFYGLNIRDMKKCEDVLNAINLIENR